MVRKAVFFPLILSAIVVMLSAFLVIVQLASTPKTPMAPTPPPSFVCPDTQWVDCLPSPGESKPTCQKEYLDWAKVNCPDFKGAAL